MVRNSWYWGIRALILIFTPYGKCYNLLPIVLIKDLTLQGQSQSICTQLLEPPLWKREQS